MPIYESAKRPRAVRRQDPFRRSLRLSCDAELHGGTSIGGPVGNDNAVKHGIYRALLTEDRMTASCAHCSFNLRASY
ncbi:hypothetical protein B0E46_02785 [Rhodanobacter sp. B04]|uniref:hypothetical protein n=1 Tax=Rhodanobacter sp. B04 TaxID=1945860 RepID=UPI0009C7D18D|nr:hypothetical protein [Rhodanobacter sp. B04]OOG66408.1 hypothetical protein B0E46_02785 [Rhodanobacter sp. B04]